MGTSFTTTHIRGAQNLAKVQFKKTFADMMKAKGSTVSNEENAALTYTLAFSPDRKWVTVLTNSADTRREAAELAKALKMHAVMIELVDSDFAELSLFDEGGAHKDMLTLGDSYLEEAAPMGDPAVWQPLLCGSWEQVQKIQNGSYTFAEDALAQFAPLIGMNSRDILLDNDSAATDKVRPMINKLGISERDRVPDMKELWENVLTSDNKRYNLNEGIFTYKDGTQFLTDSRAYLYCKRQDNVNNYVKPGAAIVGGHCEESVTYGELYLEPAG